MDCQIKYKGKDYTYDQFATLLHSGELEVLAPKMDSRYFIVNEGYNPFEDKQQGKEGFEYKEDYYSPIEDGEVSYKFTNEDGQEFDVSVTNIDKESGSVVLDFQGDYSWETMQNKNPIKTLRTVGNIISEIFERLKRDGIDVKNVVYDATDKKGSIYRKIIEKEYPNAEFDKDKRGATKVRLNEKKITISQAKKNLSKAWNKLGNQGIVYDPLQNERDFIDFVKALFDYVKVYGRDKAIPEMTKYVKTKLGIGDKGELKPEASNAIEQYAQSLLDKYNELSQKEIDAVLTAFGDNVGKESFTKNVDTMVRFGKMKTEKANQLKDLYDQASQIKTTREEEQAKTMGDKPKFASPIQILLMDVGDNASGEVLKRITQITTNNNQERSDEDIQKDATYIEESLDRLRNIAFDDASMLYSFYNSSPDWVSKFLTELEQNRKDAKTDKAYSVGSARLVGILNVMNNDTYERILQATDPIEREELMKLRDRLDSFTNDTMRDISLGLNARRSDMVLAEFARGGVLNDYATSRILTRSQTEQVARIQEAIKNKPSQKQLNNVNIPTTNPTTPSATKSKPKASTKKKVDAKFEAEMIEESKKAKTTSREDRAKELRDRLFNAINKCK